jgi:tetratricopeptide (TPR) repeat protein
MSRPESVLPFPIVPGMRWILRSALLLTLSSAQVSFAADQWLKINSSNFELFTTAGEKKGREAILYFEQVRSLFSKLSKSGHAPAFPVRIIAFRSDKEFLPYRPNEVAAAYYQAGHDRDYIVMKSIDTDLYPVAIHEYVHLIVKHSELPLPLWLNEGMAEVYRTIKPLGKQLIVGIPLAGHMRELQGGKWLDLGTLLSVEHASPLYNEKQKVGVFYAESWALAHMLYLSTDYQTKLPEFLSRVKSDSSQAALFQQVYGKSLRQVQIDLERYIRGGQFNGQIFDVVLEKSADSPEIRPATPVESGLALAELLAGTRKREEAKAAYESLARANPKDPEIELAMANAAWMNSDREEAKRHFARAIEVGTTDAKVYFNYATMLQGQDGKDAEIMALLRKATELKPDLVEAHYMLGFYASNAGRFGEAVVHLRQVKKLEKDQALPYFRTLAYALYKLGQPEEAKKNAESALKFATDPKDIERTKEFLAYLTQEPSKQAIPTPPDRNPDGRPRLARHDAVEDSPPSEPAAPVREATFPVEGTLQQVDCLGKSARLRLRVGGKPMAFLIENPETVTVKSSSEGRHDFSCGPQKPVTVALEYLKRADAKLETEGLVRTIEFR